ncbi:MAG: ABC transporter substrate-binding protein [Chloroflexota bacterium]
MRNPRRGATRRTYLAAQAGAAVALAASNPAGDQPPPEAKRLAPATLTYTTWWLPPILYGVASEEAVRAFEARHPGITVTIEGMKGGADTQLEKIQAMIVGGTPPDISLVRPHHMGFFTSKHALVAIDDRFQRDRRVRREDFFPVTLERLTWQGKTWGLPAEVHFTVLLYNQALFAAAGQPPPDQSWTWDRWLETARRLTSPPDQAGPRTFGGNLATWQILVWAWGGEILNRAETECLLSRPPAPEALQWRADAIRNHRVEPAAQDRGGQNIWQFFASGQLGMLVTQPWNLTDIEKIAQIPWNVVTVPRGRARRAALAAGANYALFQGIKHPDAAWELLLDLSVGEGLKALLAASSLFPAAHAQATPETLPNYKPEWIETILEASKQARHPHYSHPRYVEIDDVIGEQLAPVWNGQRAAKDAAEEIVRLVNPLLK